MATFSILKRLSELKTNHGDIKPANIIFSPQRGPVLIDFGFAALGVDADQNDQGAGSLLYCAPEILVDGTLVDRLKADFYSLGIVLYELAAGALPYRNLSTDELPANIINGPLRPVSDFRSDLSAELVQLITLLTEKDPARRVQSCEHGLRILGTQNIVEAVKPAAKVPEVHDEAYATIKSRIYQQLTEPGTKNTPIILSGYTGSGKTHLLDRIGHDGWINLKDPTSSDPASGRSGASAIKISLDMHSASHQPMVHTAKLLKDLLTYQMQRDPTAADVLLSQHPKLVMQTASVFPELRAAFKLSNVAPDAPQLEVDLVDVTLREFFQKVSAACSLVLVIDHCNPQTKDELRAIRNMTSGNPGVAFVYVTDPDIQAPNGLGLSEYHLVTLRNLTPEDNELLIGQVLAGGLSQPLSALVKQNYHSNVQAVLDGTAALLLSGQCEFQDNAWGILDAERARDAFVRPVSGRKAAALSQTEGLVLAIAGLGHGHLDAKDIVEAAHQVRGGNDLTEVRQALRSLTSRRLLRDAGNGLLQAALSVISDTEADQQDERTRRLARFAVNQLLLRKTQNNTVNQNHIYFAMARNLELPVDSDNSARGMSAEQTLTVLRKAGDFAATRRADDFAVQFLSHAAALSKEFDLNAHHDCLEDLARFCFLTHRVDLAEKTATALAHSQAAPLQRANAFIILARCRLAYLDALSADTYASLALEALGMPFSTKAPTVLVKVLRDLATVIGRNITGGTKKPLALAPQVAFAEAMALEAKSLTSFHKMDPLRMVEVMMTSVKRAQETKHKLAIAKSSINLGVVASTLGFANFTTKRLKNAQKIADEIDERRLKAEIRLYSSYCQDFFGDPLAAFKMSSELAATDGNWLDHADLLNLRYFNQWNLILRGYYKDALISMEDLTEKIYSTYDPNDTRRFIEYSHSAALYAVTGNESKAVAQLAKFKAIKGSEHAKKISPYYLAVNIAELLFTASTVGGAKKDLDELFQRYLDDCADACKQGPLLTVLPYYFYAVGCMDILLEDKAPKSEKLTAARRIKAIVNKTKKFAILRPTLHWFDAAECYLLGDIKKALRITNDAIAASEQLDHPFATVRLLMLKAQIFKSLGFESQMRQALQDARRICFRTGDLRMFNLITEALPASEQKLGTAVDNSAASAMASQMMQGTNVHRFIETMRDISDSLCNLSRPETLIADILDRMINLIKAERGAVFLIDGSQAISGVIARDFNKTSFEPGTTISQSVIRETIRTLKPQLSGVAKSDMDTAASVMMNQLRSIMTMPLVYNDKLIAVVYMDSRAARGLFKPDQVELLSILANNVAVTIQTAKSIENELNRQVLMRQLELTGAVQNLLVPSDGVKTFGDIRILSFFKPSAESGGDWYQIYHDKDANKVRLFIGDVTGHGPGPAMVTAVVSGVYQQYFRRSDRSDMLDLIGDLDTAVKTTKEFLMSMAILSVDLDSPQCELINLASPPPMVSYNDKQIKRIIVPGDPLGLMESVPSPKGFTLMPGERLLLSTDGLWELKLKGNQKVQRTVSGILAETHASDIWTVHKRLQDMIAERERIDPNDEDDVTYMIIERMN